MVMKSRLSPGFMSRGFWHIHVQRYGCVDSDGDGLDDELDKFLMIEMKL